MSLTAKQARFVEEYMVDLNATQAAIRAGYSKKGAAVRGNWLLTNSKVAAEVQKRQDDVSEKLEITQDGIAQELRMIAYAPPPETISATDKRGACAQLGKLLGLESPAKHEVTGPDGDAIIHRIEIDWSGEGESE